MVGQLIVQEPIAGWIIPSITKLGRAACLGFDGVAQVVPPRVPNPAVFFLVIIRVVVAHGKRHHARVDFCFAISRHFGFDYGVDVVV